MRRILLAVAVAVAVAVLLVPAAADARFNRWKVVEPYNAKLKRMAMCESGGNWRVVSASGLYMGGLQFDAQTWRSVGGRGLPHQNPRIEQKYRAVLLIRRRGYQPWPTCGRA